jgi:hypothetical protein
MNRSTIKFRGSKTAHELFRILVDHYAYAYHTNANNKSTIYSRPIDRILKKNDVGISIYKQLSEHVEE